MGKATRMVFVTACPDDAIKAFQLGAVDYLFKPVDSDWLLQLGRASALRLKACTKSTAAGI